MKQVSLIVVGAGSRGAEYASYALTHPELAKVIAVAEPREAYRNILVEQHQIAPENAVADWQELASRPKFADAVIIATPDRLHTAPAVAFAEQGYDMLLEKPMAPTEAECRTIVETAVKNRIIFGVCHVLRYTAFTRKLKEIIDSGVIGEIVNIQQLEPVGYWHQAHSFVRGNWRNATLSSPMLLQKCCHDLDWLRYIMGVPCLAVHSFGSLKHFRKENQPPNAADRCVDCGYEPQCPYSAKKIYWGFYNNGKREWPLDVLTPIVTEENVRQAIQDGPYGRCVYACDNDVVDNQVVNMQFEGERTATLTMTAFNEAYHRQTRIFGTRGQLEGNGFVIRHFDFLTDTWTEIDTMTEQSAMSGHGGGDYHLMHSFVAAVATHDQSKIISGPAETLETHLMVFASEKARHENRVVSIDGIPGGIRNESLLKAGRGCHHVHSTTT